MGSHLRDMPALQHADAIGVDDRAQPMRDHDASGRLVYRAWTRSGDPVQISRIVSWRRRGDAAAALAWVTPVSGARCLALAAYVRALPEAALHQLLAALSRERFDQLVEVAYRPEGTAA